MLLHARAGDLLERFRGDHASDYAAELAHHFTLAGESAPVRAKAMHYSLHAGKRAAELSSFPESLVHFNRAWEIIERDTDASRDVRIEGLSGRGWAEANMAKYAESVASCRQALALSTDPIQRGRARKFIAFSLSQTGAFRQLIEECEAGLTEVAGTTGPDAMEIRATLQQLIGLAWYLQGRFDDVVRLGRRIESEAAQEGPGPRLLAHWVIGWGHMGLGQVGQAIEQFELAVAEAERLGDKINLALSYQNLGLQEYLGGRFAPAREHLARSLSLFHDSASELRAASALHTLCRVWVAEGEHVRASENILQALHLEMEGQLRWAADAHHILGVIQTRRAEWDAATASFERALHMRKEAGHLPGWVEAVVALGFVDQCVGRWDQAGERYVSAVDISAAMDPSPQRVLALRSCGRLRLLEHDLERAAADIGNALTLAETMSETLQYAPTLLAMAEVRAHEGAVDDALSLATRALAHARPLDQIVEAHIVLAQIYLIAGDGLATLAQASEAVAEASRLGCPRLLSLAHLGLAQATQEQNVERASGAFQAALRHAERAGTPYERAAVLSAYADFVRAQASDLELANAMEHEALRITQGLCKHPSEGVHRQIEHSPPAMI
jgi:tetratricopeptide (TPR) repeat protein